MAMRNGNGRWQWATDAVKGPELCKRPFGRTVGNGRYVGVLVFGGEGFGGVSLGVLGEFRQVFWWGSEKKRKRNTKKKEQNENNEKGIRKNNGNGKERNNI